MPSQQEAELIASVRRRVSALLGLQAEHLDAESVQKRYADLMAQKVIADAKKRGRKAKISPELVEEAQE